MTRSLRKGEITAEMSRDVGKSARSPIFFSQEATAIQVASLLRTLQRR